MLLGKPYKNFSVEVVTCVIYKHTLDSILDNEAIDLVRYITGDKKINYNGLLLAMQFCSEILKKDHSELLLDPRLAFRNLNRGVMDAKGKSKSRKKAVEEFQLKVGTETVQITKPTKAQIEAWNKCKVVAKGFHLGSQGPGLYG